MIIMWLYNNDNNNNQRGNAFLDPCRSRMYLNTNNKATCIIRVNCLHYYILVLLLKSPLTIIFK